MRRHSSASTLVKRRTIIGWREWAGLPELGVARIKAKIDTGARSSAVHAFRIEPFQLKGAPWVAFELHPVQRDSRTIVSAKAAVVDRRAVRSSGGHSTMRYVIETPLVLGTELWPIELTLVGRDEMGFRMLIGRTAMKGRLLVQPDASFRAGEPLGPL